MCTFLTGSAAFPGCNLVEQCLRIPSRRGELASTAQPPSLRSLRPPPRSSRRRLAVSLLGSDGERQLSSLQRLSLARQHKLAFLAALPASRAGSPIRLPLIRAALPRTTALVASNPHPLAPLRIPLLTPPLTPLNPSSVRTLLHRPRAAPSLRVSSDGQVPEPEPGGRDAEPFRLPRLGEGTGSRAALRVC